MKSRVFKPPQRKSSEVKLIKARVQRVKQCRQKILGMNKKKGVLFMAKKTISKSSKKPVKKMKEEEEESTDAEEEESEESMGEDEE